MLHFVRSKFTRKNDTRIYQAPVRVCRACPVAGECITNGSRRRGLVICPYDTALRQHRDWMSTKEARSALKRRKYLVEPVFGIIKEQQQVRRFLLRGVGNVAAEWMLLATAFNC